MQPITIIALAALATTATATASAQSCPPYCCVDVLDVNNEDTIETLPNIFNGLGVDKATVTAPVGGYCT